MQNFRSYSLLLSFLAGAALLSMSCSTSEYDRDTEVSGEGDIGHHDDPDAGGPADVDAEVGGDLDAQVGDDQDIEAGDAQGDGGSDDDDVGVIDPSSPSQPTDAPELLEEGDEGFLLRGTVLTADEVLDPGEVVVQGQMILCVAADCSAAADGLSLAVIETDGVISPGLIDAHNHLPYNFLPPWFPNPQTYFNNRYEWADQAAYRAHIAPYGDNRSRGTHYCPAAKWGELRSLIHATTTIQGQSFQQRCVNWGVRNADHYHGLKHNHMRTSIATPLAFTDSDAESFINSFTAENNPTTRLAIHMAEGYSGRGIEEEFESFAGRDDRPNRHAGISLLEYETALLIHAIPLTTEQLEEAAQYNARIVWSPSSNFHLYGYGITAPIEEILDLGITTALGPDWTVSGAFDMLQEMRVAYDYGLDQQITALTTEQIWRMATADGAEAVGLHNYIGRLEPGLHADIAIFGRNGDDPYRAVLDSRAADVQLVLIDGEVYYGDTALQPAARNEHCDPFDACGFPKFICAKDAPDADDRRHERVDDLREQLIAILDGLPDAPPEEQYGRGDELLELVICGL